MVETSIAFTVCWKSVQSRFLIARDPSSIVGRGDHLRRPRGFVLGGSSKSWICSSLTGTFLGRGSASAW